MPHAPSNGSLASVGDISDAAVPDAAVSSFQMQARRSPIAVIDPPYGKRARALAAQDIGDAMPPNDAAAYVAAAQPAADSAAGAFCVGSGASPGARLHPHHSHPNASGTVKHQNAAAAATPGSLRSAGRQQPPSPRAQRRPSDDVGAPRHDQSPDKAKAGDQWRLPAVGTRRGSSEAAAGRHGLAAPGSALLDGGEEVVEVVEVAAQAHAGLAPAVAAAAAGRAAGEPRAALALEPRLDAAGAVAPGREDEAAGAAGGDLLAPVAAPLAAELLTSLGEGADVSARKAELGAGADGGAGADTGQRRPGRRWHLGGALLGWLRPRPQGGDAAADDEAAGCAAAADEAAAVEAAGGAVTCDEAAADEASGDVNVCDSTPEDDGSAAAGPDALPDAGAGNDPLGAADQTAAAVAVAAAAATDNAAGAAAAASHDTTLELPGSGASLGAHSAVPDVGAAALGGGGGACSASTPSGAAALQAALEAAAAAAADVASSNELLATIPEQSLAQPRVPHSAALAGAAAPPSARGGGAARSAAAHTPRTPPSTPFNGLYSVPPLRGGERAAPGAKATIGAAADDSDRDGDSGHGDIAGSESSGPLGSRGEAAGRAQVQAVELAAAGGLGSGPMRQRSTASGVESPPAGGRAAAGGEWVDGCAQRTYDDRGGGAVAGRTPSNTPAQAAPGEGPAGAASRQLLDGALLRSAMAQIQEAVEEVGDQDLVELLEGGPAFVGAEGARAGRESRGGRSTNERGAAFAGERVDGGAGGGLPNPEPHVVRQAAGDDAVPSPPRARRTPALAPAKPAAAPPAMALTHSGLASKAEAAGSCDANPLARTSAASTCSTRLHPQLHGIPEDASGEAVQQLPAPPPATPGATPGLAALAASQAGTPVSLAHLLAAAAWPPADALVPLDEIAMRVAATGRSPRVRRLSGGSRSSSAGSMEALLACAAGAAAAARLPPHGAPPAAPAQPPPPGAAAAGAPGGAARNDGGAPAPPQVPSMPAPVLQAHGPSGAAAAGEVEGGCADIEEGGGDPAAQDGGDAVRGVACKGVAGNEAGAAVPIVESCAEADMSVAPPSIGGVNCATAAGGGAAAAADGVTAVDGSAAALAAVGVADSGPAGEPASELGQAIQSRGQEAAAGAGAAAPQAATAAEALLAAPAAGASAAPSAERLEVRAGIGSSPQPQPPPPQQQQQQQRTRVAKRGAWWRMCLGQAV